MSIAGKALIALGKAMIQTQQNGHRTAYRVVQKHPNNQRQAPYHWHMVWGKTKYVMEHIGFNNRTQKYVYECPFCHGKAERPYLA